MMGSTLPIGLKDIFEDRKTLANRSRKHTSKKNSRGFGSGKIKSISP